MRLRFVSWNVHGCVGTDGRFDPERTARALVALAPDVALLQEVGDNVGRHPPVDQARVLADALGTTAVLGTTLRRSVHGYGNVTLSRLPVVESETYDLSVPGREPRVGLAVGVDTDGGGGAGRVLRTLNLHLGLQRRERRTQLGILLDETGPRLADPEVPIVVAGDFNDWPFGVVTRAFELLLGDAARLAGKAPPTFPSRRPLLRLDRVYVGGGVQVRACRVAREPALALASDHLPLVLELDVAGTFREDGSGR